MRICLSRFWICLIGVPLAFLVVVGASLAIFFLTVVSKNDFCEMSSLDNYTTSAYYANDCTNVRKLGFRDSKTLPFIPI